MREYHIDSESLNQIITEMQSAGIINNKRNINMSLSEFEHFIDIYNPQLFNCSHSVFDKDIFMCMGEIMYDNGISAVYNALESDEVIDYLSIMERLNILSYDCNKNDYQIMCSKEQFYNICKKIPTSFSSHTFIDETPLDFTSIDYDNMTGVEFESFCAQVLIKDDFVNVKTTPASGDHGIDILAEKDDISYAIQCKCYASNIGNSAIQQAHTGKKLYHKDIAVVLTNRHFTQQAINEAKVLGVKLRDREKLNSMIK